MNAKITFFEYRKAGLLLVLAITLFIFNQGAVAQEEPVTSNSDSGSSQKYVTNVDRKTEGELSDEDFRQVSLLTSQMISHINNAAEHFIDDQAEKARPELEKSQQLLGIIRELLPVTTVTTTVKDASGNEVYNYVEKVQDNKIPIFQKMVAVEVIAPILEVKKEQAELEGVQLSDADLFYTTVLADIKYIERKVNQAAALSNEPEKALIQLVDAQVKGITIRVDKEDHPLVAAHSALRLAERQVEEKKYKGAKLNLQQANILLETYRTLIGKSESKEIEKLKDEIEKLSEKLQEEGSAKEIRGFWHKVTSKFHRETNEAQKSSDADTEEN